MSKTRPRIAPLVLDAKMSTSAPIYNPSETGVETRTQSRKRTPQHPIVSSQFRLAPGLVANNIPPGGIDPRSKQHGRALLAGRVDTENRRVRAQSSQQGTAARRRYRGGGGSFAQRRGPRRRAGVRGGGGSCLRIRRDDAHSVAEKHARATQELFAPRGGTLHARLRRVREVHARLGVPHAVWDRDRVTDGGEQIWWKRGLQAREECLGRRPCPLLRLLLLLLMWIGERCGG